MRSLALQSVLALGILVLLAPSPVSSQSTLHDNAPSFRSVRFQNDSPLTLAVYWQADGPGRREKRITEGLIPGRSLSIQSSAGHAFRVYEVPDPETGLCRESESRLDLWETCFTADFVVPPGDDPEFTIDGRLRTRVTDSSIHARQRAHQVLQQCSKVVDQEQWKLCLRRAAIQSLQEWNQESLFHRQVNRKVEALLEKYVPRESHLEDETWQSPTLHDSSVHPIHPIENFISPQECWAISENCTHCDFPPAKLETGNESGF